MSYNVVIVDDDEIILFLHSKIIQAIGLHNEPKTFRLVSDALIYLESLSNDGESILLFLDINMPVIDGWGLLDSIHKEDFNKKIEIVMVTSSVDQEDKDRAASYSKIIDFVEKPLDKKKLQHIKFNNL